MATTTKPPVKPLRPRKFHGHDLVTKRGRAPLSPLAARTVTALLVLRRTGRAHYEALCINMEALVGDLALTAQAA